MEALVSKSLRFGSLLKPMIGLSGNVLEQSLLCWIMFQLLCMNPLMSGLRKEKYFRDDVSPQKTASHEKVQIYHSFRNTIYISIRYCVRQSHNINCEHLHECALTLQPIFVVSFLKALEPWEAFLDSENS